MINSDQLFARFVLSHDNAELIDEDQICESEVNPNFIINISSDRNFIIQLHSSDV